MSRGTCLRARSFILVPGLLPGNYETAATSTPHQPTRLNQVNQSEHIYSQMALIAASLVLGLVERPNSQAKHRHSVLVRCIGRIKHNLNIWSQVSVGRDHETIERFQRVLVA